MIDRALAAVGDEPNISAWLYQAVRELNGLKTAITDVRDELANNLARMSKTEEKLAHWRKKLTEAVDPSDRENIGKIISQVEGKREGQLEALSANRAVLRSQVSRIWETFRRLLREDTTLAEHIRTLFPEQGITIASVLTALDLAISTLILALGGGGASAPSPAPKPSGGVTEWVKNKHIQALGCVLANLAGKAAAALPGIIGSIASWLLSTLGKTAVWIADHLWAVGIAAVTLFLVAVRDCLRQHRDVSRNKPKHH